MVKLTVCSKEEKEFQRALIDNFGLFKSVK